MENIKTYINQDQRNWMLTQSYTRLMHKKYEECLTLLRGLEILCPKDPDVYAMMSYAFLEAGQAEDCLQTVDKYLECVAPNKKSSKEVHWIKSRAQLRMKKDKPNNQ